MNPYLKWLIRVLFSIAALYFVLKQIDSKEFLKLVTGVNPGFLLMAVGLFNLSQFISSLRYRLFLTPWGINFNVIPNLRLYYVGMFYNLLLPGGIGGDGYKALFLSKTFNVPLKSLILSALLDRLSGLIAILILISLTGYYIEDLRIFPVREEFLLILPLLTGWLYLVLHKHFFNRFKGVTLTGLLYSLVVQVCQLGSIICLITGLGLKTGLIPYLFVFLFSSLATIIPVSIGGIGIREMVFYWSTEYLDINPQLGISTSTLFFIITMLSAVPGAFLYKKKN